MHAGQSIDGRVVIRNLVGDWMVYPGHPLVIATAIMAVFPTYADANCPTEHGWCEALADARIPGSGCHVGAAMHVLSVGSNGGTVDEMVDAARRYWDQGQAGGHVANVPAGRHQAGMIEPHFRDLAGRWVFQ